VVYFLANSRFNLGEGAAMKKILLLAAGVILIASCVTFKVDEDQVEKIIRLINKNDTEKLTKITATPFLLDAEIIALQGDAALLWENLKQAGFTLANARLVDLIPVKEDTYKLFSPSWEVEVFFKKYVPAKSVVARIQADNGSFLLLLDGEKKGYAQILGIKGP
jgi:hypothetical protein